MLAVRDGKDRQRKKSAASQQQTQQAQESLVTHTGYTGTHTATEMHLTHSEVKMRKVSAEKAQLFSMSEGQLLFEATIIKLGDSCVILILCRRKESHSSRRHSLV